MEETISIKQLFELLRKRIGLIVVGGLVGVLIAGLLAFFILTPKYSSQAQLVVTLPQSETTNANDVNTNLQMINTYKDIITGDLVTKEVSEKLNADYGMKMSAGGLKEAIQVEQNQNSQMFSIIATSTSPREAANIANVTAEIFKENAKDVLNVDRISIISKAVASSQPVFPNKKLTLAVGLLLGLMLGVLLAVLLELLDRTVKESRTLTDEYGLTILGNIPAMTQKELNAKIRREPLPINNQKVSNRKATESSKTVERRRRNRI
ncbi:YveK family protein [Enterococcus viikkiensis]|uniref:YveK family protein n=1 Tax=Enterococcus viikkiensis TaxID=930854 RepID=UPI0010F50AAE|nr:Wzz/FepE/Etk N-terminal domain-containing protein [Enterococcus viikkiensis]